MLARASYIAAIVACFVALCGFVASIARQPSIAVTAVTAPHCVSPSGGAPMRVKLAVALPSHRSARG